MRMRECNGGQKNRGNHLLESSVGPGYRASTYRLQTQRNVGRRNPGSAARFKESPWNGGRRVRGEGPASLLPPLKMVSFILFVNL